MQYVTETGRGKPRNRATVALLMVLAYWVLPALPRMLWLPVIAIARAGNNYCYRLERHVRTYGWGGVAALGGASAAAMILIARGSVVGPLGAAPLLMGWTNFPGGAMSFGAPAGDFGVFSPFGAAYFVDSGHAQGNANNTGKNPNKPLVTVLQGVNKTTASQGDVVVLAAGHAETAIAGAATVLTNKAGVTTIGLGRGADRPTFTLSNAAGNIPVSGASSRLVNILVTVSGTTDVTIGITVTGADAELIDVELRDGGAAAQFAAGISLSTGAARAKVIRPIFRGHASGDANTAAISCAVALDGVEIVDPVIYGLHSLGSIYNVTNVMTNLLILFQPGGRGWIRNTHATQDGGIVLVATTSGAIVNPRIQTATNDADGFNLAIVAAGMSVYNPLVVNLAGETGGAWGTASAAA